MKKILIVFMILFTTGLSFSFSLRERFNRITGRENTVQLDDATIIRGLKEALNIGTDNAVKNVHRQDGYFMNQAIKILLPPSLQKVERRLRSLGLGSYIDDLILKMNRGAEKAAIKAVRIFFRAITSMTFTDAKNILNGPDDAATRYFENRTRPALYAEFFPIIKSVLDEVGATKVYKFLVQRYNKLPFVKKIHYELDEWTTNKALDGLFHMLAKEELKIRSHAAFRVTRLLQQVFGSIRRR